MLLDSHMSFFIQNCTNVEARRVHCNEDWSMSHAELLAFIVLLYVQGAYLGKKRFLDSFWN